MRKTTGMWLSALGVINSLFLLLFIASVYSPLISAKLSQGHWHEARTVGIVFLVLAWLGLSAGAIWGVSFYGFAREEPWAWFWGLVAATFQILPGFFPFIPAMSVHILSKTLISFAVALLLWFLMMKAGGVARATTWMAFLAGLAYIFSFINGVGSIARFILVKSGLMHGIYGMCQMVNWGAAAAFALFIFAAAGKKAWASPLGVFAAGLSLLAGLPVAVFDSVRIGRFSLFFVAPATALAFLLLLLLSKNALES